MKKYSRYSATKTAKSQQQTPELLDNIRVQWTIDNRGISEALWCDAKLIEFVMPNKWRLIFWGTVCYSKLASCQACTVMWSFEPRSGRRSSEIWTVWMISMICVSLGTCWWSWARIWLIPFSNQWTQGKCMWKWYMMTPHFLRHWRTWSLREGQLAKCHRDLAIKWVWCTERQLLSSE